jgi:SAM-dependent methyltransferase
MSKTITPKKQHELMYEMEKDFFWFTSLRDNEKYFINKYFKNKDKKNIRILDSGCGTGYFVAELKQMGYCAKGFDYSDTAIELSKKRGLKLDKDIFNMDIFDLKFEKETFDCIILNDVLFAFDLDEANIIIKNLKLLLKPNGILIGQTAALKFLYSQNDIVAGTKHRYTTNEIKNILILNNFKIEKLSYRNFIFFIPFAIKRFLDKKEVKKEDAKSDLQSMSKPMNKILNIIFKIDNFFLRYVNYFIGGTVFWVGSKK